MPASLTPSASRFVGRSAELATLTRWLDEGRTLSTVWGPGGMGKTRLVMELGRGWSGPFVPVELASARDPRGFAEALALALGVTLEAERGDAEALALAGRALRARRRALVILDNFEQLLPDHAEAVTRLADLAPDALFVVTSRERLRLPGESTLELAPLSLPDGDAEGDAAALLFARAMEHGAPLPAEPRDPRVLALLRRLEGIPLAIELAAARLDMLGLDGLVGRLSERLDLLSRGPRGGDDRHRTLRAAVTWSWNLLAPTEQRALAALSVLRGSFSLEAAEHVLGEAGTPHGALALERLTTLRDKSLLRVLPSKDGAPPRFSLFESVLELGHDELARAGETAAAEARADHYFLALGARLAERAQASGDTRALAELGEEAGHLLAAHERALAERPRTVASIERAIRTLLAADGVLVTRAASDTRRARWERMHEAARDTPGLDAALGAEVRGGLGRALHATGAGAEARATLEGALAEARGSGNAALAATLALDLGITLHAGGALEAARAAYESALAGPGPEGRSTARALGNLAALAHDERRFAEARSLYARAIAIAERIGDRRIAGVMTTNLAVLDQEEGAQDEAHDGYERALADLRIAGDLRLLAITRGNLGMLHVERGALLDATRELGLAHAALSAMGDARSLGLSLVRLGVAHALGGALREARRDLDDARRAFRSVGDAAGERLLPLGAAFVALGREGALAAPVVEEALNRARGGGSGGSGGPSLVEASDDARALARVLESALARARRGAPVEQEPRPEALVVGPGADTFRPPFGQARSIADHRAAHRVFARLVAERRERPGSGLSVEELVLAGWPDERIRPDAARNRLYVAITWLRKQGLGELLGRTEAGYLLDPRTPLQELSRAPS